MKKTFKLGILSSIPILTLATISTSCIFNGKNNEVEKQNLKEYVKNFTLKLTNPNKEYTKEEINNFVLNKDYLIVDNNKIIQNVYFKKVKVYYDELTWKLKVIVEVYKNNPSNYVITTLQTSINTNGQKIPSNEEFDTYGNNLKFSLKDPNKIIDSSNAQYLIPNDFNVENHNLNNVYEIKWFPNRKPRYIYGDYLEVGFTLIHKPSGKTWGSVRYYHIKLNANKPNPIPNLTNLPFPISSILEANKAKLVTLSNVNDGDTFTDNENHRYRFSGIDTPEKYKRNANGQFVPTEGLQHEHALNASNFTSSILTNPKNKIYVVPQKTKGGTSEITEHYGRYVAIIYYVDENNVVHNLCEEIIAKGLAKVSYISKDKNSKYYNENTWYIDLIKNAERESRNKQLGIWFENSSHINEIYPR